MGRDLRGDGEPDAHADLAAGGRGLLRSPPLFRTVMSYTLISQPAVCRIRIACERPGCVQTPDQDASTRVVDARGRQRPTARARTHARIYFVFVFLDAIF